MMKQGCSIHDQRRVQYTLSWRVKDRCSEKHKSGAGEIHMVTVYIVAIYTWSQYTLLQYTHGHSIHCCNIHMVTVYIVAIYTWSQYTLLQYTHGHSIHCCNIHICTQRLQCGIDMTMKLPSETQQFMIY